MLKKAQSECVSPPPPPPPAPPPFLKKFMIALELGLYSFAGWLKTCFPVLLEEAAPDAES